MPRPTPEHELFRKTLHQIKTMVGASRNPYTHQVLGLEAHNMKTPYNHLMGRRKKIRDRVKDHKERARVENIQYDSAMPLLNDTQVMSTKRDKDLFEKNMYKYKGSGQGRIGREDNGVINLSRNDVRKIEGPKKKENSRGKSRKINKGKQKKRGGRKGKSEF